MSIMTPIGRSSHGRVPDASRHLDHADGEVVFRHACKLRLEGIVFTRSSPDWVKMKNPPARP
jgi:hypothetical protein